MSLSSDFLRGLSSGQIISAPSTSLGSSLKSGSSEAGFGQVLQSAIASVEGLSAQADSAVKKFLGGDSIDIHSVAIASQRADISMALFQQVRNKVVSAYQEIMRSQL